VPAPTGLIWGTATMAHAYHDHLKSVPLFADLDADELDAVAAITTELDIKQGSTIITEGASAHEMFVVISGTLEVTRGGQHVADIGPGGFAGEMALLTHARRDATVTAKTDVSVLHLDGRSFGGMLEEAPMVAVKMLPVVAARVIANSNSHND
jgi:CRP/FNR family cyclic AMP-dependent transcriptional regulator